MKKNVFEKKSWKEKKSVGCKRDFAYYILLTYKEITTIHHFIVQIWQDTKVEGVKIIVQLWGVKVTLYKVNSWKVSFYKVKGGKCLSTK